MAENNVKHPARIAIVSAAVSFFLSAIFAAYIVGQRTGKVLEIDSWKKETAPRLERMDAQGTLSQQYFLKTYSEEQGKQYERLKKLEEQVSHLETMEWRIDRMEKKIGDPPK
jgi:hypothetical protein